MAEPEEVSVWVGLDVGKKEHFADVLDNENAMFLAAFASLRDPAPKAFYDRKRTEGKRHKAALICLARRRCDVILAMLRTGQPDQGTRKAQHTELADAA